MPCRGKLTTKALFLFKELSHILGIFAPFVDESLHVGRKFRIEADHLLRTRVDESESLGMESLTREKLETVLDELSVLRIDCPLAYLGTVITAVIEERMTYPVEMNTDLVGTAGF